MSQILDPGDVVGGYRVQFAKHTIALSALYELLLLNPQRGCSILCGLREWERSRQFTDTWVANSPWWASLGELQWKGCAHVEIRLSSCGLMPPSPRSPSLAKPPPTENPPPLSTHHKAQCICTESSTESIERVAPSHDAAC